MGNLTGKKSKAGSTDSLNLTGTENLTPEQIKAKKAELIKKMEEMKAKKDAIENEVDLSSALSITESTDKKESNIIQETNKIDMQKTAQDAVEMIDAMSAILTEQEKINGEVNKQKKKKKKKIMGGGKKKKKKKKKKS